MEDGIAVEQQQLITPPSRKPLLLQLIGRIPGIAHPGQIGYAREQTEGKGQEIALPLKETNITAIVSTQKAPILLEKVEGGVPEGTHEIWVSAKAFFGLPRLVKRVFERSSDAVLRQNEDGVWEEPETAMSDVWSEDLDKLEAAAAVWAADIILSESERLSRTKDRDLFRGESQSQLIRMLQQLPEKHLLEKPQGVKSNYKRVPFFSRFLKRERSGLVKQGGFRVFLKRHVLGPYFQDYHSKQHWAHAQSPPTRFSDWGDVSKLQISPTGMNRWKGIFSRGQKRNKSLDISTSMALVLLSHHITDVMSNSSTPLSEDGSGYFTQSTANQEEEFLPANHSQLLPYTSGTDGEKNNPLSFWDWLVCSMGTFGRCRKVSAGKKQSKLSKEHEDGERQSNVNEQNLDALFTCDAPSMMAEVERDTNSSMGIFKRTMPFYMDNNNTLSNNHTSEADQSGAVNPFFPLGTTSAGEQEAAPVVDKEEEIGSSSNMEWEVGTSNKLYQAIKTLVETKPSPVIGGGDSEVDLPTPPMEETLQSSSWIRFPFISSPTPSADILPPPAEVEMGELEVTPVARESAELFEAAIVPINIQKDIDKLASHKDELGFHRDHRYDIEE
eukprot:162012_1